MAEDAGVGARAFRLRVETWIADMSDSDQRTVLLWLERALKRTARRGRLHGATASATAQNGWEHDELVYALIDGRVEISGVRDGEPLFRLSATTRTLMADGLTELADRVLLQRGRRP